ncbi:hypothetical protein [Psychrobacter sp. SMN/5/1215-MNA-CIBAN-0208]|uniref:hypothetical protein n=1 Tax=Psychrobacter sp. SMN/5/1215-MNA-CIBAN-0208 TaxID=3140442 RepID=UPI0033249C94
MTYQQTSINHYHRLYLRDNKLVGAVLYGEVNEGGFYSELVNSSTDITAIREHLIYGAAYCDLNTLNSRNIAKDAVEEVL